MAHMSTTDVDAAHVTGSAAEAVPDEPAIKLAAQVARRIEADVLRKGWPVGESLGAEPVLRARFGVSRAVLREAVRLVEHHQVARMRRGPGGGLFVTAPDAGPATGAMVIYLEYVGTSVADLMHARSLIEPLAVRLAADQISEAGIARLRGGIEFERDHLGEVSDVWAGHPLHVLLAGLSGNPALELFVDILTRLTSRYAITARRIGRAERTRVAENGLAVHRGIADAVVAGDGGRAASLMGQYLDIEAAWLEQNRPPHLPGLPPTPPAAPGGRTKLAEVIAARIREDIAAAGWPVGKVLGSETDLLARYRISRAVLREAVRLLEYHSVARMRRGPGGGLVVTRPDPQASIDTMALHLEYRRVNGDDLRVVRDTIEMGALDRVLDGDRLADPAAGERLRAAAAPATDGPGGDFAGAEQFHTELAELAGNPVLGLFLRIVHELFRRHTDFRERPAADADLPEQIRRIHERILAALLDGDAGLARHRMRRHLEALTAWWH
jgi:DNA-binding FadR family transcriptional regulator